MVEGAADVRTLFKQRVSVCCVDQRQFKTVICESQLLFRRVVRGGQNEMLELVPN